MPFVVRLIMKLRERIVICFCVTCVLFTLLLLIDLQFDMGYSRNRLAPLVASRHGRVGFDETGPDGERSIYRKFQDRFGFAPNYVDEVQPPTAEPIGTAKASNDTLVHDSFTDLMGFLSPAKLPGADTTAWRNVVIAVDEDRKMAPTVGDLVNVAFNDTAQSHFHRRISKREMYKENEPLVDVLLQNMRNEKIVHVKEKDGGTQLKLVIYYESGDRALFKPMRFPREQQTLPNHFYFTDYERHNAEIAAFHLDKILGFRRAMPVTGRVLHLTKELYDIAEPDLLKTFFISPAENYCFHGHCSYYCDTSHAVCGNPDKLEGSFAAFLPEKEVVGRTLRKHPWRRSYHKRRKALWETDPNYCDAVKISPPYNEGSILLDLIDTSIFDFISGNMDRHHFETYSIFDNDSFPIHLDHGRAFGKPFHDELSILAPLTQCCLIKQSTLLTLLRLHNGAKKLSDSMRESMADDPITPILWEPYYPAMDRRVKIILEAVRGCIQKSASESGAQSAPPTTGKESKKPNSE